MWKRISCNKWWRLCLVQVVVLCIIFTTMKLNTLSVRDPLLLFTLPVEGTTYPQQPACKCLKKSWPGDRETADQLLLSLSWLNNITTYQELQGRHPNLPLDLLYSAENKRCSLLPTLFSIKWSNRYWQQATLDPSSRFSLYSAFFNPETGGNASIRILGVSRSVSPSLAWCHLWFSSKDPPQPVRISNVDYLDYQRKSSTRQMPFLLRCPLPPNTMDVPVAVSLLQKPCGEATNLLKVVSGRERKASAYMTRKVPDNTTVMVKGSLPAVCGPALFYYHYDFSFRLVEWLELLRVQGFGQVFLYVTDVHPNITKVLHHYTQEGFVQVIDYTYPPPYVNEPNLRRLWTLVERQKMFAQENIYFTDCVLRHMHQYRFLAHFDPDELPILPKHDSITHLLNDLVENIAGNAPPGYKLRMHYFYNNLEPSKMAVELPTYLWMLRHTQRQVLSSKPATPGEFKPIFDTNSVRGVFSHGTLLCVSGRCKSSKLKAVPREVAYYGHFKLTCNRQCKKDAIQDLTLLKYKEQVGQRVTGVLKTLQLL